MKSSVFHFITVLLLQHKKDQGIISLIAGSEAVKIEGACFLVSQVSGATRWAATDTRGVGVGEDREKRRRD